MEVDYLIQNGSIYDGLGSSPIIADCAIKNGKVFKIGTNLEIQAETTINASGKWVLPGFIDIHTHYDVEIEVKPGLEESIKHGVTTVIFGNCSLSAAIGNEKDILNLFCRVESLPRALVQKWLGGKITWKNPKEYYEHLETLSIGPNFSVLIWPFPSIG